MLPQCGARAQAVRTGPSTGGIANCRPAVPPIMWAISGSGSRDEMATPGMRESGHLRMQDRTSGVDPNRSFTRSRPGIRAMPPAASKRSPSQRAPNHQPVTPATDRRHGDPPAWPQNSARLYPPRQKLCQFVGHSADKATAEDVHRYQLWLVSIGATVSTVNATAGALRFFFKVTLKRRDLADEVVSVREPRRLPVVLSPEEVGRSAYRVDDEHQTEGGPEPDLCHRPASLGGHIPEAHRYRS